MYYLADDGKRVYTLKVRRFCVSVNRRVWLWSTLGLVEGCCSPVGVLCKQKVAPDGKPTVSAHPGTLGHAESYMLASCTGRSVRVMAEVLVLTSAACSTLTARFSPDDKFSRHRVTVKKRFGLYLPSLPEIPL